MVIWTLPKDYSNHFSV